MMVISSARVASAGIGTFPTLRGLPRGHRAVPSLALDECLVALLYAVVHYSALHPSIEVMRVQCRARRGCISDDWQVIILRLALAYADATRPAGSTRKGALTRRTQSPLVDLLVSSWLASAASGMKSSAIRISLCPSYLCGSNHFEAIGSAHGRSPTILIGCSTPNPKLPKY